MAVDSSSVLGLWLCQAQLPGVRAHAFNAKGDNLAQLHAQHITAPLDDIPVYFGGKAFVPNFSSRFWAQGLKGRWAAYGRWRQSGRSAHHANKLFSMFVRGSTSVQMPHPWANMARMLVSSTPAWRNGSSVCCRCSSGYCSNHSRAAGPRPPNMPRPLQNAAPSPPSQR